MKRCKKRFNILLTALLLSSTLLITVPSSNAAPIWGIKTVDSKYVGEYTALALDSKNTPHLSYSDYQNGDLKYATWNGLNWTVQTVDSAGAVGMYSSIAADSANNPRISYYDATNADLKYARWNGSSWIIQRVDSTGNVGAYTSIALDSANNPQISYLDSTNMDLKYAKWNGSSWNIQTVDSAGSVGGYSSVALDTNNNPNICYSGPGGFKYARWTGSSWTIQTVNLTGATGAYFSLRLDSTNNPRVSFIDSSCLLKYAKLTGSLWNTTTIDSARGYTSSIALDATGNPYISYIGTDSQRTCVKLAKWLGSVWNLTTVDIVGNVGSFSSLSLDSYGNPHIGYCDYINYGLKYASCGNSQDSVDNSVKNGLYNSIAVDFKGNPHISYYEQNESGSGTRDGNLKYATWSANSGWTIQTVDFLGDTGQYSSIAVDTKGNPHISYAFYNYTEGLAYLRYARWNGTVWSIQTVTRENYRLSPIVLDSKDNPIICYSGSGGLMLANMSGSKWKFQTAIPTGGNYPSIRLDTNGNPCISYCVGKNLTYATFSGSTWNVQTVVFASATSQSELYSPSLALDSKNNPYISYYDDNSRLIRYARKLERQWLIQDVGIANFQISYSDIVSSLAVDSNYIPCLSYIGSSGALLYAKWDGTKMNSQILDSANNGKYSSLAFDANGNPHISYYNMYKGLMYTTSSGQYHNVTSTRGSVIVESPKLNPSSPIAIGKSVTLTTTVLGVSNFAGNMKPTGNVMFQVKVGTGDFTSFGSTTPLDSNSAATSTSYTPTTIGNDLCQFRAVYSGDANFEGNTSSSTPLTVNSAPAASLKITGIPSTVYVGQMISLTVTAYDAQGKVKSDYGDSIGFVSSDRTAVLRYTPTNKYVFLPLNKGTATLTGFTFNTQGQQSLSVLDATTSATVSITINAARATPKGGEYQADKDISQNQPNIVLIGISLAALIVVISIVSALIVKRRNTKKTHQN